MSSLLAIGNLDRRVFGWFHTCSSGFNSGEKVGKNAIKISLLSAPFWDAINVCVSLLWWFIDYHNYRQPCITLKLLKNWMNIFEFIPPSIKLNFTPPLITLNQMRPTLSLTIGVSATFSQVSLRCESLRTEASSTKYICVPNFLACCATSGNVVLR